MGKIINYFIISILLIGVVLAANYDWLYNPYTGKQDRSLSLNQTGFNITADYFFGSGIYLTNLTLVESDPIFVANRTSIWTAINSLFTSNSSIWAKLNELLASNISMDNRMDLMELSNTSQANAIIILQTDNITQSNQISQLIVSNISIDGRMDLVEARPQFDQTLNESSAVTFATVNTGQGANELYDMNQNVQTTDVVTFVNITVGCIIFTSGGKICTGT